MASTVNSTAANGASAVNSSNSQTSTGGRTSLRTSSSLKGADGARRQSGSPVDAGQKRNNPPKAWTQGTNPITQKPAMAQQNGPSLSQKPSVSPKPMGSKESNTPDLHANDRLIFILTSFIGLPATLTTKGGENYTGIFSASSLQSNSSSFMLKMTQRISEKTEQGRSNGVSEHSSPYIGSGTEHIMVFDMKDVANLAVANVSTAGLAAPDQNGATSGFRTDKDISGNLTARERTLQRWQPSADADADMSLESAKTGHWDQFEANARLFGATSSYDENLYTTKIDRSDPNYKQKVAEAARIAREIESSDIDNSHMREERGLAPENEGGEDEEDKYSGVRREDAGFPPLQSGQPNKYTPPARRAPTGQPTVHGAPVDPAIISAQIARPDATTKPPQPKINIIPSPANDQEKPQSAIPSTSAKATTDQKESTANKPAPASKRAGGVENASTNVETEVLDHFRQFANSEKLKVQERRRHQASHDRTIKLNELMKFSKNFKLGTPVPKDLVPILAKDPGKQEEIIERAQKQSNEKKLVQTTVAKVEPASTVAPTATEQKAAARAAGPARFDAGTAPPTAPSDRQNNTRGRQAFPPAGPQAGTARIQHQLPHQGRPGTGLLGHRLADIQQQRKGAVGTAPAPLAIQDARGPANRLTGEPAGVTSPHKSGASQTPTSAISTKFNVRAMEFKPNPAASTFTPGGAPSSPHSSVRTQSVSRAPSPSVFFGSKKPLPASERPSIADHFNPIKRMKKEESEHKNDYAFNGGIPPAYKTPPTWTVAKENEEKTYADMFNPLPGAPSISPQNRPMSNPQMPQHQLPFNLQQANQNMPPTSGPPHGPPHIHAQHPSGPPHFDDHHRMHASASSSQVYPSPRLHHTQVGYPSPMNPHAQLAYGQQPMPQFYVGQGGPQHSHMRPFPGAPQFVGPPNGMGAPMMIHQPSSGPYMGMPQGMGPYNPQMQGYSPSPGHAYPQHVPPPQPQSGYPSPSRGAPMMMNQGSQQGHPPQPMMFMNPGQHGQPMYAPQQPGHIRPGYPHQQPHFSSSPHQVHHYPQHRAPSNGYNHMSQMPPAHMQSQGPPRPAASAPHPPEAADEAK